MTDQSVRKNILRDFDIAVNAGARCAKACFILGISLRTLQRWRPISENKACVKPDQRSIVVRKSPTNKLSADEYAQILELVNLPEYASLPPSQIVPKLADKGVYLASESTFYRILKAENMQHHRGKSRAPTAGRLATTHSATAINQVWMWDITWLPTQVNGKYYYLYQVIDLYSRYGVAWEVHEVESGELASNLMQQAVFREKTHLNFQPLILHSDNGSAMKSKTLAVKLATLGVTKSHSRPRVSDDNAYIESFFRTLKYCPKFPKNGFSSLEKAREWMKSFMNWYNNDHQHSKISFVTPAERHRGDDQAILNRRKDVYEQAKLANPKRWSRNTRQWQYISNVTLNPEAKIHFSLDQVA